MAVLLVALGPRLAHAQAVDDATRQAARNLGTSGVEAYQAQDYATATEKLEKAYRALQVPSLGLWSARALVKVNKLIEAAERYQEVSRLDSGSGDRTVQEQARADADKELDQLSPQIPNIVVKVVGTDPEHTTITIDGTPLSTALIGEKRPVNPGKHQITGASGNESANGEMQLAIGQTKTFTIRFGATPVNGDTPRTAQVSQQTETAPSAPPPVDSATPANHSSRRTLGFVTIAVGGAGLIVGGVTGVLALGKKGDIDKNPLCQSNKCAPSESSLVDSYGSMRTISSIGLIAGAVVLAGGVVLVLSAPKEPEQTALIVGPGSLALSRSF